MFYLAITEVTTAVALVILGIVFIINQNFRHWERKEVPYLEPRFPCGNMEHPFTRKHQLGEWIKSLYDQFRARGHTHGGIYFFMDPVYMPIEPKLIKNVIQTNFEYFVDRGFYYNEKDDPLSAHLVAIGEKKWRNLRTKLTSTFTPGKIKMMFSILLKCSEQMQEALGKFYETNTPVDIKEVLSCFTTDVIGSCALGLECNSFRSSGAEFRKYGSKIFDPFTIFQALKVSFAHSKPNLARKLGIVLTPKETSHFFTKVVKDTVEYRQARNCRRKDMLQILIDMKNDTNSNNDGKTLTINEIAAQAFVFFLAGFETSSTTTTFCLYELAINPDIQQNVRREINSSLKITRDQLTYETVMNMTYMDQVIEETLRKYPPITDLTRECVRDYRIPDTDITLEKGTKVLISILGLHHDPKYHPDPEKFNPERFSTENKKLIQSCTYMPFGKGPRQCIGMRFGLMQTKVALATILKNYTISVNNKTSPKLVYDKCSFILTAKGGIHLDLEQIQK